VTLDGKMVWDLTVDEIEYVYKNLHLNNYIYAALNNYHKSRMPLDKVIKPRKDKIPEVLHKYVDNIVELSPYLGNDDSRIIRINYTYYSYVLFQAFRYLKLDDIRRSIELMASLAYIPIVAEKNDNFPLWFHTVIRKPDERILNLYKGLTKKINFPSFLKLCIFNDENFDEYQDSALKSVFLLMRAVQSLIVMAENREDRKRLEQAWKNLERNLLQYESVHNLSGSEYKGNIFRSGQIRYRNTLYLYGGDFFRRIEDYDTAFAWYTKDIYFKELPEIFRFYLTDMKTTERLICAYEIAKKRGGDPFLKNLIIRCMHRIFLNAAKYADHILEFIQSHPEADISLGRIPVEKGYKLYAGEASREIYLISLLYHNIVNGIRYEDIDYQKYFEY